MYSRYLVLQVFRLNFNYLDFYYGRIDAYHSGSAILSRFSYFAGLYQPVSGLCFSSTRLHATFKENPNSLLFGQIQNLRKRLRLTQTMQVLGISSLLLCVICMFLIYVDLHLWAEVLFGIALILLILSLAISIREIQISVKALDLQLSDME